MKPQGRVRFLVSVRRSPVGWVALLAVVLLAAASWVVVPAGDARGQEVRCLEGELLFELRPEDPDVSLTDEGLYFPIDGAAFFLPEPAEAVEVVVRSGTGEPVEITAVLDGERTFETSVQAPDPTPVQAGPADTVILAGAGNEGLLVRLCYQPVPPVTTPPPPTTEPRPATTPTEVPPPTEPPDGNGGFPVWPAVGVGAVLAATAGWSWRVRSNRITLRREWELRSEDRPRSGPCRPGEMYCYKVTAEANLRLRHFTDLWVAVRAGEREDETTWGAGKDVLSGLNAAYRGRLMGETGEAEAATRLRDAARAIVSEVDQRTRGLAAQDVALSASYEGSSLEVTFHLMRCRPDGSGWTEVDRWSPKAKLKDGGSFGPHSLVDSAGERLERAARDALAGFVDEMAVFRRG